MAFSILLVDISLKVLNLKNYCSFLKINMVLSKYSLIDYLMTDY